jgi:acyl-CoA dehydrogenase
MAWDFQTEPEFQEKLDWAEAFVSSKLEPLDLVMPYVLDRTDPVRNEVVPPLQEEVRRQDLWACHLDPELGGQGYGQVKLALLNEILGRARCAPAVFGCQAPDSGNSEILARYGTEEQKRRFLQPLLAGEIYSCFSITEPQGGADPKVFTAEARQEGNEWVINGEKWFSSNARFAEFFIVMVVTDPDAAPYRRHSMFLVPADTPGVRIIRNVGLGGQDAPGEGTHAYMTYEDVRVPAENMLGERGDAFAVAQTRLGGGRIHHAMRAISLVRRAFEMMLERVVSRTTQGELLARKQMVQQMIADSWIEMESFRLLVLRTAWRIDQTQDYQRVRHDIAAVKALMPKVLHDVSARALQIHGSLGLSTEMPFMWMIAESFHMGLADGPTEVHKATLARQLVAGVQPSDGLFPTRHLPRLEAAARDLYGDVLTRHGR